MIPTEDRIFKALADGRRREILDRIKSRPGITVSALAESMPVSRFAVMKHLRILEDASLVVSKRVGKTKQLQLNAMPIQTIYDRWLSRYSALWAAQLTQLKYAVEEEVRMSSKPEHVYVLYIQTTAAQLWDAMTNPKTTPMYFHNTEIESTFERSAPIRYWATNEQGERSVALAGKVLEVQPEKRLVTTFDFPSSEDAPSRVTWEIEQQGESCKLTVTHVFDSEDSTYESVQKGWPPLLSGLKTVLETGRPLDYTM